MPAACAAEYTAVALRGTYLCRDLINTPAADMGPAELEAVSRSLASTFGATISTVEGYATATPNPSPSPTPSPSPSPTPNANQALGLRGAGWAGGLQPALNNVYVAATAMLLKVLGLG